MTNSKQESDLRGKILASGQLLFPFVWDAEVLWCSAYKILIIKNDKWGPVEVREDTIWNIYVVSKQVPITGQTGNVCGKMTKVFPMLFFKGSVARDFARNLRKWDGHVDTTL